MTGTLRSQERWEQTKRELAETRVRLRQLLKEQKEQKKEGFQEPKTVSLWSRSRESVSSARKDFSRTRQRSGEDRSGMESTRKRSRERGHHDDSHLRDLRSLISKEVRGHMGGAEDGSPRAKNRRHHRAWGVSPFSREIEQREPPRRFVSPQFKRYNGRTDPVEHILHYEQMMSLYRGEEALLCKVFPTSLEDSALSWFSRLEPRSVRNWGQLAEKFIARFVANSKPSRSLTDLLAMKKRQGEGIREYSRRYVEMVNEVEDCPSNVAAVSFKMGLPRSSELFRELAKRPPRSMNELLDRVDEHARLEEELGQTGEAVNYPLAGPKERKEVRVQYSNPRNTPPTRAVNAIFIKSQEAILEEIKGEEYFRWPPQLNSNPASRRTDVHCAYHRTNGHTTKECRHLKSHLEELAEAGHLKKYQEKRAAGREQTVGGEEVLGVIEVIHGTVNEEEYTNKGVRAQMRNLSLQHRVQSIQGTTRKRVRGQMETRDHIEFSDRDLDGVSLPHKDPLVVTLQIDKYTPF